MPWHPDHLAEERVDLALLCMGELHDRLSLISHPENCSRDLLPGQAVPQHGELGPEGLQGAGMLVFDEEANELPTAFRANTVIVYR